MAKLTHETQNVTIYCNKGGHIAKYVLLISTVTKNNTCINMKYYHIRLG